VIQAFFWVGDNGAVWFSDNHTYKNIYTHYKHHWNGFSYGSTIRKLIEALRDYIAHGTLVACSLFGPFPSDQDDWGYTQSQMQYIREKAIELEISQKNEKLLTPLLKN